MTGKILCTTCEGDPVDVVSGTVCPTCNGECMIDPTPPAVHTTSERPGYFRGAKISKQKQGSGK